MTKISQLSDIGASLAADDEFVIRDVSDNSTPNKKVTSSGFIDYVISQGTGSGFTQIAAGTGPLARVQTTSSGTTGTITFGTAAATTLLERARIDSSGRLLVGTSTASGTSAGSVTATAGIFSTNRATGTISNGNSISVTVPTRGAGFCYLVTASRREGTADNKQGLYLVHYALDQLPQAVIALNALASMTLSASTDQITLTNNLGFNTAATLCAVRIG
jgi:hypothetical protein